LPSQDLSNTTETAFILAGIITSSSSSDGSQDNSYLLSESPVQYTSVYSVNPQLTRLSDSSFAISYYSNTSSELLTRYGTLPQTPLLSHISLAFLSIFE